MKKITLAFTTLILMQSPSLVYADSAFSGFYWWLNKNLKEPVEVSIESKNKGGKHNNIYRDVTPQQKSIYEIYKTLIRAEKLRPNETFVITIYNGDNTKLLQIVTQLSKSAHKTLILETAEKLYR